MTSQEFKNKCMDRIKELHLYLAHMKDQTKAANLEIGRLNEILKEVQ